MKAIAKFVAIALATFGAQMISTSAMAQVTPPPSKTYKGIVDVEKGLAFKCLLSMTVDAGTSTVTVSLTPPAPPTPSACSLLSFVGNPYSYTFNPANGDFKVVGVFVNTITAGDCSGDITATWDAVAQEFVIDTFLPAATAGPDCTVVGIAS